MNGLTDRVAYLRGLAEGMGIDKEKNENKLLLEMMSVLDDMAQKIGELDQDIGELDEYVESIDDDLGDMEEALFGDEDEDDDEHEDGCDCDCDECEGCDDDEELSFDCPHCGKTMMLKASDIDFEESPCCPACGEPFFTDVEDDGDDE